MKIIIILLSILFSFNSFSQNKNLESDTLYIYFKNSCKYEKVKVNPNVDSNLVLKIYEFDFANVMHFVNMKNIADINEHFS